MVLLRTVPPDVTLLVPWLCGSTIAASTSPTSPVKVMTLSSMIALGAEEYPICLPRCEVILLRRTTKPTRPDPAP
jgi:hypothetical protein